MHKITYIMVCAIVSAMLGCSAEGDELRGVSGEVCGADNDCAEGLVCLPCGEPDCPGRCGGGGEERPRDFGAHTCDELCTSVSYCLESEEPDFQALCIDACEINLEPSTIACRLARTCGDVIDNADRCDTIERPTITCEGLCSYTTFCEGYVTGTSPSPNRYGACVEECFAVYPEDPPGENLQSLAYCLLEFSCQDIYAGSMQAVGASGLCLSGAR